ncbi:MAG: hypothetical protein MJZ64_00155 [Paludibacteraceae bacterium]|nr:hypothetical protein [Paludibacteraceae bacterium]
MKKIIFLSMLVIATNSFAQTDQCIHFSTHSVDTDYPYVDLDLPSGTLWASMNVGAGCETDIGYYFSWADITGHDNTYYFSPAYYNSTAASGYNQYITPGNAYDAATQNWGANWCLPSKAQMEELRDNCNRQWTTIYGVNGMKFSSKQDPNKYIFFPESGYAVLGAAQYTTHAYCWFTDWVSADHAYYADLHYNSSINTSVVGIYQEYLARWAGLPIRPVRQIAQ